MSMTWQQIQQAIKLGRGNKPPMLPGESKEDYTFARMFSPNIRGNVRANDSLYKNLGGQTNG